MTPQPPRFDALHVGQELPALELPPLTRHTLALYCGASGDHNPIHVDIDFAQGSAGLPDVIAHGMLGMAWMARVLTNWAPQSALRGYGVRFAAMTRPGEAITCTARVDEKFEADGEKRVRLTLTSRNAAGEIKLSGHAEVACT